jgi:hypothetical protein
MNTFMYIAVAVAGPLLVWAKWRVEQARENRKHHREIVHDGWALLRERPAWRALLADPRFHAVEPHLSGSMRVRRTWVVSVPDETGGKPHLADLRDELARLEREWRLV